MKQNYLIVDRGTMLSSRSLRPSQKLQRRYIPRPSLFIRTVEGVLGLFGFVVIHRSERVTPTRRRRSITSDVFYAAR